MNTENRQPAPDSPHQTARTRQPAPDSPHQTARTDSAKQFFLALVTLGGSILFVLFAVKIAPPAQAQGTPTPTPSPACTTTPTPTVTPSPTPTACSTCSPHMTPNPQPPPTATPLPSPYQPDDHSTLEWRPYTPAGDPPWPAILLLHEGNFYTGSMYGGVMNLAAQDLADAGYYVLVASYRLAPCGVIKNQPCHDDPLSGRPPEQTDDVKAEIRAIRADTDHCDGKVGVVGGSAGGSHAIFAALDTTTSSNWSPASRPDCAVGLSGAYDFADRTPENYPPSFNDPLPNFIWAITNYTNEIDLAEQKSVSPVALITTPSELKPFIPIFAMNSRYDPMPYHQILDLQCALEGAGVSSSLYEILTIPDSSCHGFGCWYEADGGYPTTKMIKTRVIEFLDTYLK